MDKGGGGIPAYLRKGWREKRYRRIVRFRLRNEMKEERYWKGKEERKCRLYESGIMEAYIKRVGVGI